MVFIHKLINATPFTMKLFFCNYSINIFRFFLSTQKVEELYEVSDLYETVEFINAAVANNSKLKNRFLQVTSANVISIYMKSILTGCNYLPSLIGIPKLMLEQTNCKNMVRARPPDYSCMKFYTPYRKIKLYINQPLRLWFADDKEQVTFGKDQNKYNIYIETENNQGNKRRLGTISRPDFVLLNLQKVNIWILTK